MARTIVILHPGGLGDLLLAVPALDRLRARYPHRRLMLCGQDEGSGLLQACRIVDDRLSVQGTACSALFAGSLPDESSLKKSLNSCDLAVAWTKDDAGILRAALTNGGASAVVVRSPFSSGLKRVHQSDRFLEILGEPAADSSMVLSVPDSLRHEGAAYFHKRGVALDRPLAIVHPGSGSRHKCVKVGLLIPVMKELETQGLQPLLLEGPADGEIVRDLFRQLPVKPLVLRDLSVSLAAGVLSQAGLFLGHDSGMTHLSALLGVPTVALFGPTDPARWAPRGPAVRVLRANSCRCFTWDAVSRCVEKPCLEFSPEAIQTACQTARPVGINPRHSLPSALSPNSPLC
jgi:heptosyltransferase III